MTQHRRAVSKGRMTHADVIQMLQNRVDEAPSLREWCSDNDVQAATCSRILNGKLPIQDKVLKALGLCRVISYRKVTP